MAEILSSYYSTHTYNKLAALLWTTIIKKPHNIMLNAVPLSLQINGC